MGDIYIWYKGGVYIKKRIIFVISIFLLGASCTFTFYNSITQEVFQHFTNASTPEELQAVEDVHNKIKETEFTQKILNRLEESGYAPQKRIQYTIYSPKNKVLSLSLANFDGEDQTMHDIINIVDEISKENHLYPFTVEVSESKN